MPNWIFIVQAHWNHSLEIAISQHLGHIILTLSRPVLALTPLCIMFNELRWLFDLLILLNFFTISCVNFLLLISRKATNINFIVFDFTWPGIKPTIYHTCDEHNNHYITEVGLELWTSNSDHYDSIYIIITITSPR